MTIMPDETRRFYNPITLIIEDAAPAYARAAGLVEWDGEVEEDGAHVVRASLAGPDLDQLNKAELQDRARDLGLDETGTKAALKARLESHVDELDGEAIFSGSPVEFDGLHSDSAAGDESTIDPQKEG